MLFPTLVERRRGGDEIGFSRALADSLRYAVVLLLAPAAAAGGAAYGVMALYGEGFDRAADALAIALVVPAIAAASKIQRWALFSVDRPWTSTISGLLRMVVTVAATIGFGIAWGPTGVAAALVLGYLADLAFLSRTLPQHLSVSLLSLWPAARAGRAGARVRCRVHRVERRLRGDRRRPRPGRRCRCRPRRLRRRVHRPRGLQRERSWSAAGACGPGAHANARPGLARELRRSRLRKVPFPRSSRRPCESRLQHVYPSPHSRRSWP